MAYFLAQGWTHNQAAGIVGNLQVESNVDPGRGQDGGGPGYGLAQWEGPRQRAFQAWAGKDIHGSSMEDQLAFIQHELETTESGAAKALRATNTPEDAARVFCERYERPGISHLDRRMACAKLIASMQP